MGLDEVCIQALELLQEIPVAGQAVILSLRRLAQEARIRFIVAVMRRRHHKRGRDVGGVMRSVLDSLTVRQLLVAHLGSQCRGVLVLDDVVVATFSTPQRNLHEGELCQVRAVLVSEPLGPVFLFSLDDDAPSW